MLRAVFDGEDYHDLQPCQITALTDGLVARKAFSLFNQWCKFKALNVMFYNIPRKNRVCRGKGMPGPSKTVCPIGSDICETI